MSLNYIGLTVLGLLVGALSGLVGIGMDYVSCSPYRVPIARLAAAQAVIAEARAPKARPAHRPPKRSGRRPRAARTMRRAAPR